MGIWVIAATFRKIGFQNEKISLPIESLLKIYPKKVHSNNSLIASLCTEIHYHLKPLSLFGRINYEIPGRNAHPIYFDYFNFALRDPVLEVMH